MIRTCDGTDPNLVMYVNQHTGQRLEERVIGSAEVEKPCDCGLVFDDVTTMVIYPHRPVR